MRKVLILAGLLVVVASGGMNLPAAEANTKALKVFVLAGDESMLRQGSVDGRSTAPSKKQPAPTAVIDKPGTLLEVVKANSRYRFLKDADGSWAVRKDVALYDAHPLSNNTRSPARILGVPTDPADPRGYGVGAELMFGQVVGEKLEDPVLLIRFATKHEIWFRRGSRSLGYDYLSPAGGGGLDLNGGWDVIHFNHGVWDQAALDPKKGQRADPAKGGVIRTSIEDYEKNLRAIVARLKKTGATLIWAHTTPILVGSEPGYIGGEMVDKYNAVAAKIMNENGVIIDDLNAECRRQGKPKALNVHDVGNLAPKVTEVVKAALAARKNPSRPLPRVLFIGDSITGTYWEKVKQNLDGIAFVAKNPGNGEHSGTGARMVDQWVDLKQYLLNGQEYLELVSGVKQTLADINRYCPDFAGRTPELAGFVWFQGIADAQSDAFTKDYEKNLTALIRDLRVEFKQPKLPFVVVALGQYGDKMLPNTRKVHDAQMAVGNPVKHPEFSGNVASVETIPFYFPKEKSPGGREWDYQNNAESFLLIGEAMGKAMAELEPK
jgi:lysophospholipase L1-like esterase